jgi:hypothetical protein
MQTHQQATGLQLLHRLLQLLQGSLSLCPLPEPTLPLLLPAEPTLAAGEVMQAVQNLP